MLCVFAREKVRGERIKKGEKKLCVCVCVCLLVCVRSCECVCVCVYVERIFVLKIHIE